MAASNGSTAIRDKILASLARYRALRIGKFPCAFWRLSSRPGLTALVFHNGLTLPLFSEFMSHTEAAPDDAKQDCELKAFKRLAGKIKQELPQLPIMILLDGLYSNGPVFELCIQHGWDSMIVLKKKSLKSVWKTFNAQKGPDTPSYEADWRGRKQKITWVNHIPYALNPSFDFSDNKLFKNNKIRTHGLGVGTTDFLF